MTKKQFAAKFGGAVAVLASFAPGVVLAQAYGQGSYGESAYGSGVLTIGSIPITGPTLISVGGLGLLSIAVGLAIWGKQQRG